MAGEWLCCNKCCLLKKSTKLPFLLTQCGHFFCQKCISKGTSCPECKIPDVQTIVISDNMPQQVANLFVPIEELVEQVLIATKFQINQYNLTSRRLEDVSKKYNTLKMAFWKTNKQLENLTIACKQLQDAQKKCEATHKRVESPQRIGGITNSSRSYFTPVMLSDQNQRASNYNRYGIPKMNHPMHYQHVPVGGYQTDDSDTSMSTIRSNYSSLQRTPIMNPDGIFRIPRPPKSGASSNTSGVHSNGSDIHHLF